ncbi:MAG TPA: class 1 fructose-bisphosphatase [Candidatus Binataceae bacterium]|nr:class 1 fructose-bisphosphatase [Candidatus Binataceae bacterium]
MINAPMTLSRYLNAGGGRETPGEIARILEQLALAGKRIASQLRTASLTGELGLSGAINVQGEKVEKLDDWSNQVFVDTFSETRPVCTLVSEEMDGPRHFDSHCTGSGYALLFDPLDGSSNTDVNGILGSIFSIRNRRNRHGAEISDILAAGTQQLAAGYFIYGPATMMVWTAAAGGVNAFTLDSAIGEFVLWREDIMMPPRGKAYSVNQGNAAKWHPGARTLIERLTREGSKYSLRYWGALVGDFHRCLLEGGIYMYPGEPGAGKPGGKIRLMYEIAPLAMVAERAGGSASTGRVRALDVVPAKIHERAPVYIGSREEVGLAEKLKVEG